MLAHRDPSIRSASTRGDRERLVLLAARSLVDRIRQLYRELEQMTDAQIGVHRALNAIGEHPGIQASQLATTLEMQRSAVSQVLKGMVERGWVELVRPLADQRAVQLFTTDVGDQVLRATAGQAVATLQRSVRSLGDETLEHLAIALPALLSALPDESK